MAKERDNIPGEVRREEEIKEFWAGFCEFRSGQGVREMRLRAEIREAGRVNYSCGLKDEQVEQATEVAMLFLYGMHKAREVRERITEPVKVPYLEVGVQDRETRFTFVPVFEEETTKGWVEANIVYLVEPEWIFSSQIKPWSGERKRTVSKYLPDWVLVDVCMAAAEEYAHNLFCYWKSEERLAIAFAQRPKLDSMAAKMTNTQRDVVYHMGEFERRGLVWQLALLRMLFPSWTAGTCDLVERVKLWRNTTWQAIRDNKKDLLMRVNRSLDGEGW